MKKKHVTADLALSLLELYLKVDLGFFNESPKSIADSLRGIANSIFSNIDLQTESHLLPKLPQLLERLKAPSWTVGTPPVLPSSSSSEVTWKNATVEWLMNPKNFSPQQLPRLHGREIRGSFESAREYLDMSSQLWTGMTWYHGYAALTPACRFLF